MNAVPLFLISSLCLLTIAFGELVVDTEYWDSRTPSVPATCENRNEAIFTKQNRQASICKDGTDMPWTQVPIPKARLYYCTEEGELMYKECTPFQYTQATSCQVDCSAPIKSTVDLECYHGVRLHTISCEAAAPTFVGSYLRVDQDASSSMIYGPQRCQDAWGPNLDSFGCNATHYWPLTGCHDSCSNCLKGASTALAPPYKCINSKSLQCYEGFQEISSADVPLVTKVVDSDTVCGRFDYKCHTGDCTCTKEQQNQRTCKRAHAFMSASECGSLSSSSEASANVYCCSSNKCNSRKTFAAPCAAQLPPQVTIYDEKVSLSYSGQYSGSVTVNSPTNPRTGLVSMKFLSLAANPSTTFTNTGGINTALGYTSISFYAHPGSLTRGQSANIQTFLLESPTNTRYTVQSTTLTISNTWALVQFSIPIGIWNGIGFVVSGSASVAYIDTLVLV